ncbi:hypothetical protein C2845_PM03G27230 [Panicum miliaceum]|uniref:KIB1-4 beta-propeller domain-containing protein n=1 Tax=Panicum miliaceum TaxID=4540 RepID=A0A3L6T6B3_PANMI|nr:hypothetical protein C2845_PM03G27230 [Panicum miliaceum]
MEAASCRRRTWADLPPDLIRHISGTLHDAADSVRFHAACRTWRGTLPASHPPPFLPWLLAPGGHDHPWIARFRSIFSKTTWCAPGTSSRRCNCKWLASADGVGAWLLVTGGRNANRSPPPRLVNPFMGAAATLPCQMGSKGSSTSSAPTASSALTAPLLCTTLGCSISDTPTAFWRLFSAPGDAAWAEQKTVLMPLTGLDYRCAAAYHRGEIVLVDLYQSSTVKLRVTGSGGDGDDLVQELSTTRAVEITPDEHAQRPRRIYTFESRGELLAVVVALPMEADNGGDSGDLAGALSVWVYAMEAGDGHNSVRWARRDGRGLRDRVLFLGWPTSFAVDPAPFGGAVSGGSAFFVLNAGWGNAPERSRVYRHSFGDGSKTVAEELPAGPGFTPQPSGFAPAQDIGGRLQVPREKQAAPCPIKIIRGSLQGSAPSQDVGLVPESSGVLKLHTV